MFMNANQGYYNTPSNRAAVSAWVSGRDGHLFYHLHALTIVSHLYGFIFIYFFGQLVDLINSRQLQKKYFDE